MTDQDHAAETVAEIADYYLNHYPVKGDNFSLEDVVSDTKKLAAATAELQGERDRYKREIEAAGNNDFDWSVLERLDRLEKAEAELARWQQWAGADDFDDGVKGFNDEMMRLQKKLAASVPAAEVRRVAERLESLRHHYAADLVRSILPKEPSND